MGKIPHFVPRALRLVSGIACLLSGIVVWADRLGSDRLLGWLGGESGVQATRGQIDGEGCDRAATVPALRVDQSAPVADTVTLDRDGRASGADGPHVRGAVAGDRDGSTVGGDLPAMLGAVERGGCYSGV